MKSRKLPAAVGLAAVALLALSITHAQGGSTPASTLKQHPISCTAADWPAEVKKANEAGLWVDIKKCLVVDGRVVCMAEKPEECEDCGK